MTTDPMYFEGSAVITNTISTGACFCVSNYGDVYIPPRIAKVYHLRNGQHITIAARKNFKNYDKTCAYVIVEIKDANPPDDNSVATQIDDHTEEDTPIKTFRDLSDAERWEAVVSLGEDVKRPWSIWDYLDHLNLDDDNFDDAADYLTQCVSSSALWNVTVTQGPDENSDMISDYFVLYPKHLPDSIKQNCGDDKVYNGETFTQEG